MNWQHYTRLIQAKSTSTAAWQIADHANYGSTLDMLALAIHRAEHTMSPRSSRTL